MRDVEIALGAFAFSQLTAFREQQAAGRGVAEAARLQTAETR